jgi:hypothetical protein
MHVIEERKVTEGFWTKSCSCRNAFKELSHEIFTGCFWLVWIYLGLNGNRFMFLSFTEIPSILDS